MSNEEVVTENNSNVNVVVVDKEREELVNEKDHIEEQVEATLLKRNLATSPSSSSDNNPFSTVEMVSDQGIASHANNLENKLYDAEKKNNKKSDDHSNAPAVSLAKDLDISIDDSLILSDQRGPEIEGEEDEDDLKTIEFKETPVNERITLPLGLEKNEFKSSPTTTNNNNNLNNNNNNNNNINNNNNNLNNNNFNLRDDRFDPISLDKPSDIDYKSSPTINSNNFLNRVQPSPFNNITYSPTLKPYNKSVNNNKDNHEDGTTFNSSVSELPYIRPVNDDRYGGFGMGGNPMFNRSIEPEPTPMTSLPRVITAIPTRNINRVDDEVDQENVPMVDINILPEVGANGAEPELEPERPKLDPFPIILCLISFLILVGVSLIIFFV
ncbi:hypothetical protein DFA_04673 [Cavenderia fasciculata]|uniref:Uncharacterized protein n=1 Tax=Cavenderia fasciculata TaxID=261658 RepID=F4PQ80_CACFS|nr:uncharacterized protein DFA_04673 [Cavenderia fasciculata]EGG22543.1 hypothetical protein DFA_04673 [Cavenderia fasciculata]|eukprot:XP_004360394.1 hypothetical protein DFA_04673 [Cavenderia fasciculata]